LWKNSSAYTNESYTLRQFEFRKQESSRRFD